MEPKTFVLLILNILFAVFFIYLMRRPKLLSFHEGGRWWLTWLAVAVITLMDEFTSIFYAPAEAYRFIGMSAIVYIAVTSVLIRFMSTRFTEIAEILEHHGLIGGGVYSFSYLVLGPMISFAA
ncbi:MAG TPA: amino acid transporter, partial [Syntrophobacteraceae bacterium]|nr:amino acid transporter [Syntrophobacteraceae bacterium]